MSRAGGPPGGPPLHSSATLRQPVAAPVAAPVANPRKASPAPHYATLPATSSRSPPLKTPSPAPASAADLASFYGAPTMAATTADDEESGAEGQPADASSAASFYASAAAASTPKGVAALVSPGASARLSASNSSASSASPAPATRVLSPTPSVLQSIAAKFVCPPLDLTASPTRMLVKEGFIARQARFKSVLRYAYLFNDLFVLTEPVDEREQNFARMKLKMKQVVQLEDSSVQNGKKSTIFILDNVEKPLYFECGSDEEAHAWRSALEDAIAARKTVAPVEAAQVETSGQSLFTAIAQRDEALLLYLLSERGDDPEQRDASGFTALHRAARSGFHSAVSLLLAHGAQIGTPDPDGKTALHVAALADQYAVFLLLLSRRPNIDLLLDMDGRSCLWDLVQGPHGQADAAAAMAALAVSPKQSASPPQAKQKGKHAAAAAAAPPSKPLDAASAFAAAAAAGTLGDESPAPEDEEGRDTDASDDEEDSEEEEEEEEDVDVASPRSAALSPSQKEAHTLKQLAGSAWDDMVECVRVLIEQGCDLEAKDRQGRTVIMHLAATHQFAPLKMLIGEGASLSSVEIESGATALHCAVCPLLSDGLVEDNELADVLKCVNLLLESGLAPNLRDNALNTPLHLCKSLPVAGALLVHGARGDLKNDAGMRATQWFEDSASKGGDMSDIVSTLKGARDTWLDRGDTFLPQGESLEANTWLDNELSDSCLFCQARFTLTTRRHHCRRCGMLVCGACSSKKFTAGKDSGLRSCDACFNVMASKYLIVAREQRRAATKKREQQEQMARERKELNAAFDASHKNFLHAQKAEEERIAAKLRRIEEQKANPDKPLGPPPVYKRAGAAASSAAASSTRNDPKSIAAATESTSAVMAHNRQLAQERGEKLSQMEDKAARLEKDADNFASMAAQLKNKYKNSWF